MKITRETDVSSLTKEKIHAVMVEIARRCEAAGKPFPGALLPASQNKEALLLQLKLLFEHAEKAGVSTDMTEKDVPQLAPPKGGVGNGPPQPLIPDGITGKPDNSPEASGKQTEQPSDAELSLRERLIRQLRAISHRFRRERMIDKARERGFDVEQILSGEEELRARPSESLAPLVRLGEQLEVELCKCPTQEEAGELHDVLQQVSIAEIAAACGIDIANAATLKNATFQKLREMDRETVQQYIAALVATRPLTGRDAMRKFPKPQPPERRQHPPKQKEKEKEVSTDEPKVQSKGKPVQTAPLMRQRLIDSIITLSSWHHTLDSSVKWPERADLEKKQLDELEKIRTDIRNAIKEHFTKEAQQGMVPESQLEAARQEVPASVKKDLEELEKLRTEKKERREADKAAETSKTEAAAAAPRGSAWNFLTKAAIFAAVAVVIIAAVIQMTRNGASEERGTSTQTLPAAPLNFGLETTPTPESQGEEE